MNIKIKLLMEKYPELFKGGEPRCGFYVDDGWLSLLDNLFTVLNWHLSSLNEFEQKSFSITQIKEKFGALRVYTDNSDSYARGAILLAELMSEKICERCGNSGALRSGGWMKTLCDSCFEKKK